MASNSKTRRTKDFSAQDQIRLRGAVREIAESSNLRFFLRSVLGNAGLFELVPSDNALSMARFAGRHELGQSILATLNDVDPTLYPNLLLEEHHELLSRAQAGAERPERGDSEPVDNASGGDGYEG